jgi:drug/metabolite transporter (DMT)-like permease
LPESTKRRAYLAWIAVCLIWGTTYLFIRISLDTMPPFLMAGLRWLLAGSVLIVVLAARGVRLPPPSSYGAMAVLGILMLGFGNGGVVWAQQVVPSGLASVIVGAVPFWMVGIERLAGGDALTPRRLAGLLVGFLGIVVLVWPEVRASAGEGRGFVAGLVALQLASLGWALGSNYARQRRGEDSILAASALQMLFAGIALTAVATLKSEWAALWFTPRTAGALTYLVLVGSIVGYTAYAYALNHLPLATVSLYAYINPIIAVALGTLVLNEPFNTRILVAGVGVFAGVALVKR